MWRQLERIGIGFLVCLPLFIAYWFGGLIHLGDEIFDPLVKLLLGKKIFAVGFSMLLCFLWCIGFLFDVPYVGPFLARMFHRVPFVGAVLQRKDHFDNLRKLWGSSGCGPIFVSLYREGRLHPAAITKVFLTDYGYLAVIGVAAIPPQELYYFDDDVVYYGLSASEVSAIHISFGFGAKRADLRGIFKRATIKEIVERFHLYQENHISQA
ncbi:hypothetical protein KGQ34_00875 [Patescibacteria group bacterium]|nr:hypothetical protein [Patescibacteria group bacterium]